MSESEQLPLEAALRTRGSEDSRSLKSRVRTMKPENITCSMWLEVVFELFPGRASKQTNEEYRLGARPFAEAHRNVPVGDVTAFEAQRWAMRCSHYQLRALRVAWEKAVLAGVAPLNVWRMVEVAPRIKKPRIPPTQEQLDAALARARQRAHHDWPEYQRYSHRTYLWDHFADLLEFAAYTGARLGGCRELKRPDVDLEAGRATLTEKGNKTRTVALLGPSREAIARACWSHPRRTANGLVFMNGDGRRITSDWIAERWHAVRGDFGGPFHSLRHFAATWMLEHGASELDVAVQLGHTDSLGRPYPELIRRVYGHPEPEDALQRLEAAIGREGD